MRCMRWLAGALCLLVAGSESRAQGLVGPASAGYRGVFFSGTLGHSRTTFVIGAPYALPPIGIGCYPICPPVFLPPPNVTFNYYPPPPVVMAPPPRRDLDLFDLEFEALFKNPLANLQRPAAPPAERPLPGAPASVFRPIGPENRARALKPAPAEQRRPQPPAPKQPPDRPKPPEPQPGPLPEGDRLLALGKESMAQQEYGRAAQRFQQALAVAPDQALAYFLLAQAQFALGKYPQAVELIHLGMRVRPDWPAEKFSVRGLYGAHVANFLDHVRRLEEAVIKRPEDPAVLFLYAYQLWFDDRKDQAIPFFQRAARFTADKSAIERFLQAAPQNPVVVR